MEIERKPTADETADFVNIGKYRDRGPEEIVSARMNIISRIKKANRYLIIHSKPQDLDTTFRKLSCAKCFQVEHSAGLVDSDDFTKIFKRYTGRRKLELVFYHNKKNGLEREISVAIRFKQCEYCGGAESICFSNHEINDDLFRSLKNMSMKDIAPVDEKLFKELEADSK